MELKRYLPIVIFCIFFSGFIFIQSLYSEKSKIPTHSETEKDTYLNYEEILKNIELRDLSGNQVDLLNGTVLLNFWASWCGPCKEEVPWIKAAQKKLDGVLSVVSINTDELLNEAERKKVIDEFGITYPVVFDGDEGLADDFGITNLPFTLLLHDGKVVEEYRVPENYGDEKFIALVKSLNH